MCTKERLYDTFAVQVYVERRDCMMVLVIIRVCIRGGIDRFGSNYFIFVYVNSSKNGSL